jgi:hypothetical protein
MSVSLSNPKLGEKKITKLFTLVLALAHNTQGCILIFTSSDLIARRLQNDRVPHENLVVKKAFGGNSRSLEIT